MWSHLHNVTKLNGCNATLPTVAVIGTPKILIISYILSWAFNRIQCEILLWSPFPSPPPPPPTNPTHFQTGRQKDRHTPLYCYLCEDYHRQDALPSEGCLVLVGMSSKNIVADIFKDIFIAIYDEPMNRVQSRRQRLIPPVCWAKSCRTGSH